jgi:hypothetical protein
MDQTDGPGTSRPPSTPAPPVTGDRAVDDVLVDLARALDDGPAERVEALTEAHRALQARLTSPVPPAAAPGEARPGPVRP